MFPKGYEMITIRKKIISTKIISTLLIWAVFQAVAGAVGLFFIA